MAVPAYLLTPSSNCVLSMLIAVERCIQGLDCWPQIEVGTRERDSDRLPPLRLCLPFLTNPRVSSDHQGLIAERSAAAKKERDRSFKCVFGCSSSFNPNEEETRLGQTFPLMPKHFGNVQLPMNRPFDWFVACASVRPPMRKERHHTTTFMSAPSLPVDSTPSCKQCRMRSCLFTCATSGADAKPPPSSAPLPHRLSPTASYGYPTPSNCVPS